MRNSELIEGIIGAGIEPANFWLVLDIPTSNELNNRDLKHLEDLSKGELQGVKGISASKEILTDWWIHIRNAAIFLKTGDTLRINDLEQIEYNDPDQLCANGLRILARLFDKDVSEKYGLSNLVSNIGNYVLPEINKIDHQLGYFMNYHGVFNKLSHDIDTNDVLGINTHGDLTNYIWDSLGKLPNYERDAILTSMDKEMLRKAIVKGLRRAGSTYESEAEWMVNGDSLKIPPKSILLLGIEPDVVDEYRKWKENPDDFSNPWRSIHHYRIERYKNLMDIIVKYRLRERYDLRVIDAKRFDRMRSDLKTKRRKNG